MGTTPMFAPDGTLGDIPNAKVKDAVNSGFTLGFDMTSPDGKKGTIPVSKVHDAIKAGFSPFVPTEAQAADKPAVAPIPGQTDIENEKQRLEANREKLEQRQQRAMRSPTPVTNATSIVYPAAEAPEIWAGLKRGAVKLSDLLTGTKGAVAEAEAARAAELTTQKEAVRARSIGVRQNVAKYQGAQEDLAATNATKQSEYIQKLAEAKAKIPPAAPGEQQNWIDLNKSIQTSANPSQLKVALKAGATDFADVTSMPGRGLAAEGLDAKTLAKMSPIEQRKVLDPIITKAGKAVSDVAKEATKRGVKVDLYSVDEAVDSLADSKDREAVHSIVNRIGDSLGIKDWGNVTPTQALKLRQELYAAGGDNAEFASRAITRQLREAVPESQAIDRHFTDLASARTANDKALARYAAGKWSFPNMEPSLPEAPTPKDFKHPAYKGLTKVPETPDPVDVSAIRKQQLKKAAKRIAIGGGLTYGGYEAGKHVALGSLLGN